MNKNTTMFLGLLLVGGAAYYFVSSTKGESTKKDKEEKDFVPPATNETKASPIKIASTVAQALKDNENPFVYNGKLVYLNYLLGVSKFQLIIDKYTLNALGLLYTRLQGKYVAIANLPYGEPNKGNIDRYILDRLSAPASVKKYYQDTSTF